MIPYLKLMAAKYNTEIILLHVVNPVYAIGINILHRHEGAMLDRDRAYAPELDWRMARFAEPNLSRERLVHVALKVYYDGSSDGKKESVVTLTGVAATEPIWSDLEPRWAAVTERYSV